MGLSFGGIIFLISSMVIQVCIALMCVDQETNQKPLIWRKQPINIPVIWSVDAVCSSTEECYGLAGPDLIPQLCPVEMQENDHLFFKTSQNQILSDLMNPANVSYDEFENCPSQNHSADQLLLTVSSNEILHVPSKFLTLGQHYFAQVSAGIFLKCQYGLRVNIFVKDNNCRNLTTNSSIECSDNGVCDSYWFQSQYTCTCDKPFVGVLCGEFDACADNPCVNNGVCKDVSGGENNEDYICDCPADFSGENCSEIPGICEAGACHGGECVTLSPTTYRCLCPAQLYGPYCENTVSPCNSKPCQNGGVCSDESGHYQCICNAGYTGADCEIEVDECLPTPCQNNTECVDLINDFHCECGIGFTGYFCEVDIDLCTEGACGEHSLFCTETEYGHNVNCTCESGYTGSRCEENIDDCQSRPCKNGAICLDHINAYQCYCVDGYAGSHCEVNFDECGSSPCLNNGTCVDGLAQFTCFCVQGFEGKECQNNIDDCSSNPCSHNGTCHDGVDSFVCDCPIPYQGVNCSLLPCDTEPCLNDGVCESNVTDNATAEFTCTCLPGFDGVTCELSYLNCMSKPGDTFCNGHGLCVPGEEDYHCLCEPGYAGKDCQQPADYCTDHDCRNNATCVNNVSGYQCLCGIGWEGALCEREGNECEEWQPCSNGSTCVDLFNDYRCECAENWTGRNCTVHLNPCKSSPCPPSATCVDRNDIFRCICPPFLTGEMCDTVFNPCSEENNPCQNEAVCIVLTTGIAQCLCAEGFTGARCEVNIDDCVDDPCQNNGTCEDLISQYRCHCVPGYHGDNCEINTDECEPNPCKNGSTCYDLINQYKCECVPGFRSRHCDVEIDFCAGRPCSNNATCKSDPSGYLCICLPFFTGIHCETELDYCKPQPCQNNGTCHSSVTGYACVCSEPFTGMICADQIDYCQSEPCLNNGTCVNENNSYVCHCVLPYAGDTCENVTDFCDDNQCQNGGLCFSSDSGFNCSCPEFWTGKTCDSRIDFCERQPCFNEAVCENMLTGYLCHCVTGFTGDNCENKTFPCRSMPCQNNGTCAEEDGQFICSCSSGYKGVTCSEPITACVTEPCLNNATCLPSGQSYRCLCPIGFTGSICENAVSIPMFQFLGDGLLWYQEVDILPFFGITFNFNTTKDMGTLLYAMNENDADDHFLHLYIESGFLKYEFSCIVQTFDINTHLAVSDGHITTVTIVQNANCLSTLEVRTHLATFPLFWNVGSSNMPSRFHFTAVSDLFIGGIPNIVERLANFTGCLGDIVFDGIFPLPTDQSVNVYKCGQDISPPPSEVDLCEDIACQNGGTCRGRPSSQPVCDCPLYFTGPRCQQEITIYFPSFNGNSYLIHRGLNFSTSTLEILLSVKTTHSSGTVLFTQSSSEAYIHLHIDDGVPRLQMSCDDHNVVDLKSEVYINTGELIIIMLRLTLPFEENRNCHASLVVGNNIATSESYLSFGLKVNFEFVYLAGIPQDVTVTKDVNVTNFIGCIREFQIGTDEIDIVRQAVEGQNIVDCEVPACSYQPCSNGDCYEDGESWYCDCYVGYGGSRCERKLCQTNICQHGGTCIILEAENEEVCLCSLGRGGVTCQDMVSITMPSFSGNLYGYSSFMAYSTIPNSHNRLEVKFQFNLKNNGTSMKDNLVLFIADTNRGMESDYMAVGIYKQYLVLSYNLGSGNIHIWSPEQINPSMALHNVHFGRHNQAGWMLLDDQHNVSGQSPGQLSGLNGELGLYVGGFESLDFNSIPLGARFLSGFQGCIFNLMVKSDNAEFISPGSPPGVALMGRNIQQCEGTRCQTDLCHNGATCIELGSSFYCNCTIRWKGTLCMDALDSCNIGHDCADGATCIPKFPAGHICSCPLGKRGQQCEEAFVISDPVFVGERSFMALPSLNLRREANIAIQFKPYSLDGLLFYIAQHLSARSGDFLAISLNHGFLELRYNLGSSQTTVLKSVDKVSNATDTWYTAGIVRNLTHGLLSLGNNSVSVKTKPGMTMLDTTSDFFLGGLPDLELLAPSAVANEPTAFEGCVRELIVNSHLYELNAKGALYGRDVNDCDGTGCGHAVCQNSGSCLIQSDILDFQCECTDLYAGRNCESSVYCQDHACYNTSICVPDHYLRSYTCVCHLGWQGDNCEQPMNFTSARLKNDSYLHYVDEGYDSSNRSVTVLSFSFRTTKDQSMIMWNGELFNEDKDYLGIGLAGTGHLKVAWNLGWRSSSELVVPLRLNDDNWHTVYIIRNSRNMVVKVENESYSEEVFGDFTDLDTKGLYYIGGFGLHTNVAEGTSGLFQNTFSGCFKDWFLHGHIQPIALQHVHDGLNVQSCEAVTGD